MTNSDGQYVVRRRTHGDRGSETRAPVDGPTRTTAGYETDERSGNPIAVDPSLQEVLTAVFDLREHERETYRTLLSAPGSTTRELAAVVDRDRSNVNRSLSALAEKGLVTRRRRILEICGTSTSTPRNRPKKCESGSTRRSTSGYRQPTPGSTSSCRTAARTGDRSRVPVGRFSRRPPVVRISSRATVGVERTPSLTARRRDRPSTDDPTLPRLAEGRRSTLT